MKETLKKLIDDYNPDVELYGSGNEDLGHNLAEVIERFYGPKLDTVQGDVAKENNLRMEIRRLNKHNRGKSVASSEVRDYYINKIINRLDKIIEQDSLR